MKAIAISRFGPPEVLDFSEVEMPQPGSGEVSVDVAFAGINFVEVLYRQGLVPASLPFVPGIEVSGHIREVGPDVEGLKPGEAVAALTIVKSGGYGEVVVTAADLVAKLERDEQIELATAAGVPSNTTTAYLVIDRVARLKAGDRVLIHAAAGGVGTQLGQVAKSRGASLVVGTVGSPSKAEVAARYGYDQVIVRSRLAEPAATFTDGQGFDIVIDPVGGEMRERSLDLLAPMGRLVVMGNASGADDVRLSSNQLWLTGKTVAGFNLADFSSRYPAEAGSALRTALAAVAAGDIHLEIEEIDPRAIVEAHRCLEAGQTTGKLVMRRL
jgi:NADPH2:quinone reductase